MATDTQVKKDQARLDKDIKMGKLSFTFVNKHYELLDSIRTNQVTNRRVTLKLFLRNKLAMFSLIMLILTIVMGIIMPLTTMSPTEIHPNYKHGAVISNGHILGTDLAGRDIWARLWSGLRFSLGLAAVATMIDIVLGIIVGLLMGYFEAFDRFMQFSIQVITNVPQLFILTIFVLFWNPTFWVLALSMVINGWIPMAQYTRSEILRYKVAEYSIAEKALGAPTRSILKSYMPSLLPIIITQLVFTIPTAIQYDASLALIGLAVPNIASIGNIISDATPYVTQYPLEIVYPVLIMTSIIVYVQFIGNGIEDAIQGGSRHG